MVAHSDSLGTGSEFVVLLPLARQKQGERAGNDRQQQTVAPLTSSGMRILIADDNVDAASTLAILLELLGNKVKQVNDGAAAVEAAASFRPQVALIDIGMPKLNGYQVCQQIRQQEGGMAMVIIAVTVWGQPEDRRKSADAGFNHHLVKPVDPSELAQLLAKIAGSPMK